MHNPGQPMSMDKVRGGGGGVGKDNMMTLGRGVLVRRGRTR